ncbi:LysE family translocator [Tolumonas osonensis]|uniref:Threonine/homoserine/homoserine lactone efflux protein n=1 Tax=Tolumonas osonensis TaxID=675874 RepID=A0A841GAN4_9GAMM|nr:LysE family translocator [Tolumonas osonensis]MBB6056184.1 threonine/homoserine/homoserine lactone efflux protein [Tolumonas osonensis]
MFGTHDLALFMVSGFILNVMPGPDTLLIMSKSASQGWRAGSVASLGIGSGVFVHIVAAALGLSAILASSATAFLVVKYAGAAYLVYIGLMALRQKSRPDADTASPAHAAAGQTHSMKSIYWQGFLSNALNPKVALFFLAFVPQFIGHDAPDKALAFIVLGLIFNFNSMLWCHFLAVSTALASQRLKVSATISNWLNKTIGVLFISLGVKLALSARN